ncbi:transcription termination/antitermination protein NusA [bacterium]|nr:transcription termination/antitermination protein NusA [bacterium]
MVAEPAIVGNSEILQVAEAVSREKGIDREAVIEALEQAIQVAARRKYGHEMQIISQISRKTGMISLYRQRNIVEVVENYATEMDLEDAKKRDPKAELGGVVSEALPPIDFGRVVAQTAKQVIIQKVRDAERDVQFNEFRDRVGTIINGVVKRVEYGNVVIDLGRSEAVIYRERCIPREMFKQGDRVRAYVEDVRRERSGPQIFLSRVHPQFIAKLFEQEVPEVYDGIIEIKAVARDPGSRAKMCVSSNDPSIDPVGSCVGVRGSRVQAVIQEIQGEKIDIIPWSPDPATLVVNALAPAEVAKVVIDENRGRIEVVVPDEQLSIAIGRRGQNVRLAADVTGWEIDILTEETSTKKRQEEFARLSRLFIEALDVEDVIGELLVTEGFQSVEEVAFVSTEDLASIEGFDADVAEELQRRAKAYLDNREQNLKNKLKELGMEASIATVPHLMPEMLAPLQQGGVKTLDDLADLARDEFNELVPGSTLNAAQVDEMIMKAREHWFKE